jgi:hypothetical protein
MLTLAVRQTGHSVVSVVHLRADVADVVTDQVPRTGLNGDGSAGEGSAGA